MNRVVERLRNELNSQQTVFPAILSKVIQNGKHCVGMILMPAVRLIQFEIQHFDAVRPSDPDFQDPIRLFRQQLTELIECSILTGNQI